MEIGKGIKIKYEAKTPIMYIAFATNELFIFEGERGEKPTLDILIKYKDPTSRPRSISHQHWAVDALIKKSHEPELTNNFLTIIQSLYHDKKTVLNERTYQSLLTLVNYAKEKYDQKFTNLDKYGDFECELVIVLVTLLAANEKNSSPNAYMYENLINILLEEKPTIFDVISKAGVRGK